MSFSRQQQLERDALAYLADERSITVRANGRDLELRVAGSPLLGHSVPFFLMAYTPQCGYCPMTLPSFLGVSEEVKKRGLHGPPLALGRYKVYRSCALVTEAARTDLVIDRVPLFLLFHQGRCLGTYTTKEELLRRPRDLTFDMARFVIDRLQTPAAEAAALPPPVVGDSVCLLTMDQAYDPDNESLRGRR